MYLVRLLTTLRTFNFLHRISVEGKNSNCIRFLTLGYVDRVGLADFSIFSSPVVTFPYLFGQRHGTYHAGWGLVDEFCVKKICN